MLAIISINTMTTSTVITGFSLAYSLELAQRPGQWDCEAQVTGICSLRGDLRPC